MSGQRKDFMGTPEERFWAKVRKGPGCWEWTGATTPAGYGRFAVDTNPRRMVMATRYSWELANGEPFPDGLFALHHCDNPPCVRPDHLYPGTLAENHRDARDRGRWEPTPQPSHCKRGHALSGDNVYIHPSTGRRMCHTCHLERARRWREAKADAIGRLEGVG